MKNVKNAHMGNHLLTEVYNVPFDKLNNSIRREKWSLEWTNQKNSSNLVEN